MGAAGVMPPPRSFFMSRKKAVSGRSMPHFCPLRSEKMPQQRESTQLPKSKFKLFYASRRLVELRSKALLIALLQGHGGFFTAFAGLVEFLRYTLAISLFLTALFS